MTNFELINLMIQKLKKANQNEEIAFFIFFHFSNIKNKLELIENKNEVCENYEFYLNKVEEYINNKPLAKILGETNFYGRKFAVYNEVFSPRVDTEVLVTKVLENISNKSNLQLVDVCAGTGVIGLSLKKESNNINNIYLIDLNPYAIKNIEENAKHLDVKANIYEGDLLKPLIDNKIKIDVLVSNPPYISFDEELEMNVDKYDPKLALYADENGLSIYKQILIDSRKVINPNSYLIAFEIGYKQAKDLEVLSRSILGDEIIFEVHKDINQLDRVVIIRFNF